jgi:hypothetical protein
MVHQVNNRLYALPASVFAAPDFPVASKVSVEALMGFVPAFQQLAQSRECGRLVLECQGQLNSPMAFFALKSAGLVVIPLGKPTEAAYALASVKRLVQVYKHKPEKFILAAAGNPKAVESAASISDKNNEALEGLRITAWDSRKIKTVLEKGGAADISRGSAEAGDGGVEEAARGFWKRRLADGGRSLAGAMEKAPDELTVSL